jgi:hypothetical protein
VAQLRAELKELGLETKGKKSELQARLIEVSGANFFSLRFPKVLPQILNQLRVTIMPLAMPF